MSDPIVQPIPEPIPQPGLSQMQRVIYTFTAPSKTFNDIKAGNKSWWMPFLITVVVSYMFFAAVYFKIGMNQVVENQIHLSPKQEQALADAPPDRREMSMKISLYVTEGAFIATPVLVLAGIALLSLGLWGTINFAFGGKATYGKIFTSWMYAGLPGIIKVLLGIIVVLVTTTPESFNIKNYAPTNIASFLSPLDTNKALYALLSSLDVITIWSLALLAIGAAIVAGVKRGSGYITVFGWWILFVIIGVGFAVAFG